MKYFISFFILAFVSAAFAQGTGDFEIKNNDFRSLFNEARVGQPDMTPWAGTFWPYGYHGTAAKVEQGRYTEAEDRGTAPMEVFDKIANLSGDKSAYAWERETHSCKYYKGEEKMSCESWWGHCNGWAAAAIKEFEPKKDFRVGGVDVSVSDAKGIFAEVWLSTNSLGAGITDKSKKTKEGLKSGWIEQPNHPAYKSYWDITPRAFFMTITNYMGINKMGFAIDRFTGDEVWNQPLVGYRILPLRPEDIRAETKNGRTIWAVSLGMKIYWGNDLGTSPGVVSGPFNINSDTEDDRFVESMLPVSTNGEVIYEGRLLEFTLFFSDEVKLSKDGKKVLSAGKLIGNGIWKMQENPRAYTSAQLDEGHPDFIWMPTNALIDDSGYGNPFLVTAAIQKIEDENSRVNGTANRDDQNAANATPRAEDTPTKVTSYRVAFSIKSFENLREINSHSVQTKVLRVFKRSGLKAAISPASIEITDTQVSLTMDLIDALTASDLKTIFSSTGMTILAVDSE